MLFKDIFIKIKLILFLNLLLLSFERTNSKKKSKGIINIPFKKKTRSLDSLKPEDIVYPALKNTAITTEIKVGTEPQTLTMKIELVNYSFYIYGKENDTLNSISKYKSMNYPLFEHEKSSTFNQLGEIKDYNHQTSSFIKGFLASDYSQIGNQKFKTEFILATNFVGEYSGGIGLRINDTTIDGILEYNFLKQLKVNDQINDYYFTIKFINETDGNLIIGDLPEKYDSNNYKREDFRDTYIETSKGADSVWNIKLDNIYTSFSNNKNKTSLKSSIGYFRTNMGVILGTESYRKDLEKSFFGEEMKNGNCFEEKKLYYVTYYCKRNSDIRKVKNLYFYNKELNYTFILNSYDLFYKDENTGNQYFLVIFDEEEYQWLLGLPFLRNYQIVFNQDKKKIGLYVKGSSENIYDKNDDINFWSFVKKNQCYLIVILILFVLVIILAVILCFYCKCVPKRKKKANELDDEYDYDSRING